MCKHAFAGQNTQQILSCFGTEKAKVAKRIAPIDVCRCLYNIQKLGKLCPVFRSFQFSAVRYLDGYCIQWGSEIQPFKIQKHLKSGLFEYQISNGPDLKGSGYSLTYSNGPNHLKTGPFKIWTLLP